MGSVPMFHYWQRIQINATITTTAQSICQSTHPRAVNWNCWQSTLPILLTRKQDPRDVTGVEVATSQLEVKSSRLPLLALSYYAGRCTGVPGMWIFQPKGLTASNRSWSWKCFLILISSFPPISQGRNETTAKDPKDGFEIRSCTSSLKSGDKGHAGSQSM